MISFSQLPSKIDDEIFLGRIGFQLGVKCICFVTSIFNCVPSHFIPGRGVENLPMSFFETLDNNRRACLVAEDF